ncbi:hypothetical protein D9M69_599940 [compost metagenome]
MMEVHQIQNERDYQRALQIVSKLIDSDPARGTPDGDRLEMLAALVERYEAEHFQQDLIASKKR